MSKINSLVRTNIRDCIKSACIGNSPFIPAAIKHYKDAIEKLKEKNQALPVYGLASVDDFGDCAKTIAVLGAYTNKQYYLYRAIGDRNKVGYLSRKQYMRYRNIKDKETRKDFLKSNGRMVSLYKMLERARNENPFAKFLNIFEKLYGSSDLAKDHFESFSLVLHNMHSGATIEECTIQDAYDLPLRAINNVRGGGYGSGERFAITSCMEGNSCEPYYKAFGVKAYKVIIDNQPVGRFLTWKTAMGKTYVDRLYCNGRDARDALSAMEQHFGFDNVIYYPSQVNPLDYVKCIYPEYINMQTYRPYVDSFCITKQLNDNSLILQQRNGEILNWKKRYVGSTPPYVEFCACGELLRKGEKDFHEYVCPKSTKKIRNKNKYSAIYKLYQERQNEPLY